MFIGQEGTIEIELAEFFEWLGKNAPSLGGEIQYGVPRINKANMTMEIDFASSTDGHPTGWAKKPKAVTQWDELK